MPSRVRRLVKQIWKRQDKWGESWEKIASEMAGPANKILEQRLELVMFTCMTIVRENVDVQTSDKLARMSEAKGECDALLAYYAYLFTIGISANLAHKCRFYAGDEFVLGGLADIVDFGVNTPGDRRRQEQAVKQLFKKRGWKLPDRECRE